jgi:hypothetical protein
MVLEDPNTNYTTRRLGTLHHNQGTTPVDVAVALLSTQLIWRSWLCLLIEM